MTVFPIVTIFLVASSDEAILHDNLMALARMLLCNYSDHCIGSCGRKSESRQSDPCMHAHGPLHTVVIKIASR